MLLEFRQNIYFLKLEIDHYFMSSKVCGVKCLNLHNFRRILEDIMLGPFAFVALFCSIQDGLLSPA